MSIEHSIFMQPVAPREFPGDRKRMSSPSGEVSIRAEGDIVVARRSVRDAATQLGFGQTDVARIVTAASELARNVYRYAGEGVMRWRSLEQDGRVAIEVQFLDRGPGIANVDLALR